MYSLLYETSYMLYLRAYAMPPTSIFFWFHDLRGRELLNRKRVSILAEMHSNRSIDR